MNVRLLLASVLLLTSPFAAFAQSNSSLSDSALAQQVIDAEHAFCSASIRYSSGSTVTTRPSCWPATTNLPTTGG